MKQAEKQYFDHKPQPHIQLLLASNYISYSGIFLAQPFLAQNRSQFAS